MTQNTPAPADLVEAVADAVKTAVDMASDEQSPYEIHRLVARAAIVAHNAHMASDGVVQADQDRATDFATRYLYPNCSGVRSALAEVFAAHRRAAAGGNGGDNPDEAYKLGKEDGFSEAVQRIDMLTGGDGEYFASTTPGRGCPDAEAMIAGIVERTTPQPAPRDVLLAELKPTFRTTYSSGGESPVFEMRFRFRTMKAMHRAEDAWHEWAQWEVARTALANSEGR